MRLLENLHGVASIDAPYLGEGQIAWGANWPEGYLRYQAAFAENLEIDDANMQQVADAVDPEAPNNASLDEPKSFLDQLVPAAKDGGTDVPSAVAEWQSAAG